MSLSPNRLLASLSATEYRRIAPALHTTRLSNGSSLPKCGAGRVYFPGTGVCSILRRMSDATTIEVASVGGEGVVGLPALGSEITAATYLQVSYGSSQYMSVDMFRTLCQGSELGLAVDRFCGLFTRSVMQLVACNRLHAPESRCARWLLLTHLRLGRARFELTQPFLAMAIGITPDELVRLMVRLAETGVVKHDAATVTIIDPIALRRFACSCYGVLNEIVSHPPDTTHAADSSDANVLRMSPVNVCTVCGLTRNSPHRTHVHCLRAIDAEIRSQIARTRELTQRRARVALESMEKFQKFSKRRRS